MVFNSVFLVHTKSRASLHGAQAKGDGAVCAREEQASDIPLEMNLVEIQRLRIFSLVATRGKSSLVE